MAPQLANQVALDCHAQSKVRVSVNRIEETVVYLVTSAQFGHLTSGQAQVSVVTGKL